MVKKLVGIAVLAIMLLGLLGLAGCAKKASEFTEEEHIQRVTERIQKRFIDSDLGWIDREQPIDFEVHPLYDENDELKYFLVDFDPYGFLYVLIRDEGSKFRSFFGASTGMYRLSDLSGNETWSPYTIDETNSQPDPDPDKCWKLDENGEKIIYDRSPYYIAGIVEERRYLLLVDEQYTTAIKREGKYVNLISSEEAEIIDGHFTKKQAYAFIRWDPPKKEFDL